MTLTSEELEHEFYARFDDWWEKTEKELRKLTDRKMVMMKPVFFSFDKEVAENEIE